MDIVEFENLAIEQGFKRDDLGLLYKNMGYVKVELRYRGEEGFKVETQAPDLFTASSLSNSTFMRFEMFKDQLECNFLKLTKMILPLFIKESIERYQEPEEFISDLCSGYPFMCDQCGGGRKPCSGRWSYT